MLWQCQESKNLIGDFKIWLNNNNINLTFLEEIYIFNIGEIYTSANLHNFYHCQVLNICGKTPQLSRLTRFYYKVIIISEFTSRVYLMLTSFIYF